MNFSSYLRLQADPIFHAILTHLLAFMELFHFRIALVLNGELTAYLTMCQVAGVDYAALQEAHV